MTLNIISTILLIISLFITSFLMLIKIPKIIQTIKNSTIVKEDRYLDYGSHGVYAGTYYNTPDKLKKAYNKLDNLFMLLCAINVIFFAIIFTFDIIGLFSSQTSYNYNFIIQVGIFIIESLICVSVTYFNKPEYEYRYIS